MRTLALVMGVLVLVGFCTSQVDTSSDGSGDDGAGDGSAARASAPTSTPAAPQERTDHADTTSARQKQARTRRASPADRQRQTRRTRAPHGRTLYPVLDVVDGDTVKVGYRGGVSVRVIGIDTPETVHPTQPDECWGPAASAAATRLLQGRRVALVFDPTQGRTDTYGRTLAYVEIPGVGDFGRTMLRRGHAAEYTYDTAYRRQGRYRAAERSAKAAGRAMWGRCGGPDVPLHAPSPSRTQPADPGQGCAPGYDPCVPPYPPDLDCADVNGPVYVSGSDPHGLDGDGDGVACES